MNAVENTRLSLVKVLVQKDYVNVNLQDEYGNTALHVAVEKMSDMANDYPYGNADTVKPQLDIVQYLAKVADVTLRNHDGKQPIHQLLNRVGDVMVLHRNDEEFHAVIEEALMCLVTPDVVNYRYANGLSLLSQSVWLGQHRLVELLLKEGADVTIPSQDNHTTALHLLAKSCRSPPPKFVTALIKNGMLNAQDKDGNTALHFAVMHRNLPVLQELKKFNGDVNITNKKWRRPIDVFQLTSGLDMLKDLLEDEDQDVYNHHLLTIISDCCKLPMESCQQLKEVLTLLCERMHGIDTLCASEWSCYKDTLTLTMTVDHREVFATFTKLHEAETFSRILHALPIRIRSAPTPLYSADDFTTPESAKMAQYIDQMWKDYVSAGPVLLLSQMCRRVIRKSLHPFRRSKFDRMPNLPNCLKEFLCQTDIAESMNAYIMYYKRESSNES